MLESSKNSLLNNEYFHAALSILAMRPALIERLFITKEWNESGFYRLRICKGGEWQEVTIDDLFPCEPNGLPIFDRPVNNELWVMLLEKAYAKVHGSYFLLKGGFVSEVLMDLTGCPTTTYFLADQFVQAFIKNGQFWDLLSYYHSKDYILCLSTQGEKRWSKYNQKDITP